MLTVSFSRARRSGSKLDSVPAPRRPGPRGWDPHDARNRKVLTTEGPWEFRVVPAPANAAGARRQRLHGVQLWHPQGRVSVLTPALSTEGWLEVFPVEQLRWAVADWDGVAELVRAEHGLEVPAWPAIVALYRWFLRGGAPASEAAR
jgi:hypothetical protein